MYWCLYSSVWSVWLFRFCSSLQKNVFICNKTSKNTWYLFFFSLKALLHRVIAVCVVALCLCFARHVTINLSVMHAMTSSTVTLLEPITRGRAPNRVCLIINMFCTLLYQRYKLGKNSMSRKVYFSFFCFSPRRDLYHLWSFCCACSVLHMCPEAVPEVWQDLPLSPWPKGALSNCYYTSQNIQVRATGTWMFHFLMWQQCGQIKAGVTIWKDVVFQGCRGGVVVITCPVYCECNSPSSITVNRPFLVAILSLHLSFKYFLSNNFP